MALINCPDCKHPMSEEAKVCPNCNKPRSIQVGQKLCVSCQAPMDNNKRKCPTCGSWQGQQSVKSNNGSMATKKSNATPLSAILLGLLLGGAVMYLTVGYWNNAEPTTPVYVHGDARTSIVNGMYVFINSEPACTDCYESLGNYKGESTLDRVNEAGVGKEKVGRVLGNLFSQLQGRYSLKEHIDELTQGIKQQYPQADGIIIRDKLNQCEVIRYR